MAVGVYIHPRGMTKTQYEAVGAKLEEAGQSAPAGRTFHACFGSDEMLMVFDVWETPEDFMAFAQVLGPLMAAEGIQTAPPQVLPLQNVVVG